MIEYSNGPVGGWVGYERGDGFVDFFADDGTVHRWSAADDSVSIVDVADRPATE